MPSPALPRPCPAPSTGRRTPARLPTWLLALATAAAAATAQAAASPVAGSGKAPSLAAWEAAPATPPRASAGVSAPWWMAFDDATLNLLVHWAQQRQAGLQALQPADGDGATPGERADDTRRQVVASYLGARVFSVRWLALNGVRNAADRQHQLLTAAAGASPAAAPPSADHSELLASLRLRSERVGQQQQALATQREALLQNLASLCGLPTGELGDLLAPALAQSSVPTFGSAVPAKLPRSILRARADVAAAEAAVLRSLRGSGSPQHAVVAHMQQPAGWIDADGETQAAAPALALKTAAAAPAPTNPELDELNALLDRAAQEVAHDLRSLAERARLQAERAQLADASRQAFFAAREQLKSGELNELQVLEQYQRLLAESDRYAAASGELAMAWLRLVASTGASEQVLVRR